MIDLIEHSRRKPRAEGTAVTLADGHAWILANPTYIVTKAGLTRPSVDAFIDNVFECSVLDKRMSLSVVHGAARQLLRANYELSEDEISELLSVAHGPESRELGEGVVTALFGSDRDDKGYTSWVRASLIANGLGETEIPAEDLVNVLTILVATRRTIPLSTFAYACRLAETKARLETLV